MFVVIYEFEVKEGMEKEFEENWAIVTDAIRRTCSSLGSRLHRPTSGEGGSFIAYAQWPTEEIYDRGLQIQLFTEEELLARENMKSCCQTIKTLHRLNVVNDRLVKE